MRRLTIEKPIGGRLYKVVTPQHPILVHKGRWQDKIRFEVVVFGVGIFNNHPYPPLQCYGEHLDNEFIKHLPVPAALEYYLGFFVLAHLAVVYTVIGKT